MEIVVSIVDYLVFAISLVVSLIIGVYYGYRGRNEVSSEDYFVGGRTMNVFAVGCSALISTFSATVFLAYPNDTYFRGPGIWFCTVVGNIAECIALSLIFVPVYHRLKLTNIYDYLELRFNKFVKYYAVLIQVVFIVFYMAVNIYVPALAMSVITNLNINLSILIVGGTCVVYTTMGGIKAVVWTDVFQTVVIAVGVVSISIVGMHKVNGINNLWSVIEAGNRQVKIDFSTDLKRPYTFWSAIFAFSINGLTRSGVGQYIAQRYLTVKSTSEAQLIAVMGQFFSMLLFLAFIFIGLIMYTFYAGCDPFTMGIVQRKDEVFPLFIKELLYIYPGLIGLLIAAMFSSSISTVSSGINSQAAITHTEISKLFLKNPTARQSLMFTKAITALFGIIFLATAFLATYIGSIVDAVLTWSGILLGPVLGVFLLGMFARRSNSHGALIGMIISTIVGVWLKIGNSNYPKSASVLPPLSIKECNISDDTMLLTTENVMATVMADVNFSDDDTEIYTSLYQLSPVYYGTVSCGLTILIGMLVSFCTGPLDPASLNQDLLIFPQGTCHKSSREKKRTQSDNPKVFDLQPIEAET